MICDGSSAGHCVPGGFTEVQDVTGFGRCELGGDGVGLRVNSVLTAVTEGRHADTNEDTDDGDDDQEFNQGERLAEGCDGLFHG